MVLDPGPTRLSLTVRRAPVLCEVLWMRILASMRTPYWLKLGAIDMLDTTTPGVAASAAGAVPTSEDATSAGRERARTRGWVRERMALPTPRAARSGEELVSVHPV